MPLTPGEISTLAAVVSGFGLPGLAALVGAARQREKVEAALKDLPTQRAALEAHKAEDETKHAAMLEEIRKGFQQVSGDLREVRTDVSWLKREQGGR